MTKIIPFLTYKDRADEAVRFYCSIFKDSRITNITHYPDIPVAPKPGAVMTVEFELAGQPYVALNGGDHFAFTDAFSLNVVCENQQELDAYWDKLTGGGGEPGPCGWLKDRFGMSWQLTPKQLPGLLSGDPARSKRVMDVLLKMSKLDLAALERAAAG